MSNDFVDRRANRDRVASSFSIDLAPEPVAIAVGRSIIRRSVTFVDADAESSFLVAVTEIVANAIDEHERIGSREPIVLDVEFGGDDIVRVVDRGEGFETISNGAQVDTVAERGRGLALARAFVERLHVDATPTGTTVALPLAGLGIVR